VTYDQVIARVHGALDDRAGPPLTVDAINTMGMAESCLDERMRKALATYDLIVPDGMPLVWSMNRKGANLVDRVYGPYLTERMLVALERPTRIAVIGGFPEVHEWLSRAATSRFPNADFVLLYDAPGGPIDEPYVEDCVGRIRASGAELVFVCLGVPRQYHWTALAKPRLDGGACVSVGGAFDLIAGNQPYAPHWMQRAGLTWLYRLAREPRRLGRRYLKYNSAFIWFLLTRELLPRGSPSTRATGSS
jgi:N-acetylglucosaminyldiphosphoundecaprenol N-acetyl-beta-D-mannosaminyltransferase